MSMTLTAGSLRSLPQGASLGMAMRRCCACNYGMISRSTQSTSRVEQVHVMIDDGALKARLFGNARKMKN